MATNQIVTGPQNLSDSIITTGRGGKQGEQMVSELHGRYYEQTYRGNVYGITGALTTTTAAGAATFTGLIVGNPSGSGVNLAVNKCFVSQGAALTAETEIGIMFGANVTTASLSTIFNRNPGCPVSKCVANAFN